MPVPGRGDGDLCRAKASTVAFYRKGSNAGLLGLALSCIPAHPQLCAAADVPNAIQAVVTCAMRGPCRPGKEIYLNEKDQDRHIATASLMCVHTVFLQFLV